MRDNVMQQVTCDLVAVEELQRSAVRINRVRVVEVELDEIFQRCERHTWCDVSKMEHYSHPDQYNVV